jgi:hypothetical protein
MGRVMRYNGIGDPGSATQILLAWAGRAGASRRDVPVVELLAKVAGMGVAQFVRDHTTLPLRRAVAARHEQFDHGDSERKSLLWSSALRDARPGSYFCVSCIHEDLDFHGTCYWRREHQLPGLYCCAKHNRALSYVETADAFLSSPAAFVGRHRIVDERWVAALQGNQPIQRFLAVSSDLLARSKPLNENDVAKAVRERATELGLHPCLGLVKRNRVTDLVRENFDSAWLASVVPGLIQKPEGWYWPQVDRALPGKRSCLPSTVYAVLFSALFDSSDEAINAMVKSTQDDNAGDIPRSTVVDATDQQIRAAYIANLGCHSAVARSLGISADVARRRLLEQGLPSLVAADASALQNAAAAVLIDGATIDDASQINGVHRADLEKLLVRCASPFCAALSEIRKTTAPRRAAVPRTKPTAPPQRPNYSEPVAPQNVAQ